MRHNEALQSANLPKLEEIGDSFLWCNKALKSINLSHVEKIGWDFMFDNKALETICLPENATYDSYFLRNNQIYKIIHPHQDNRIHKATTRLNNIIKTKDLSR